MSRVTILFITFTILTILNGCAATGVAISKRNLDVQTKMSSTVFLDPIASSDRNIYVQLRNTSDKQDFFVENAIKQTFIDKGFRIKEDPNKAYYILQANILQVGKSNKAAMENSLLRGYGDAAGGAAVGALSGAAIGQSMGAGVAGAVIGGVGSFVANSLIQDVYYSVMTDIQISERVKDGRKVVNHTTHNLAQGTSGGTTAMSTNVGNRMRYQTRILSSANQANLKWEDAATELTAGLVRSITNIF